MPKRSTSTTNISRRRPVLPGSAAGQGRRIRRFDSANLRRRPMTITLNHAIVPARDKVAAAKFFAHIFGLKRGRTGYFSPVRVNKTLTLLFDDDSKFESHHYAFHVSNREFDAILRRVKKADIEFGSAPWSLEDGKLN